MKAVIFDMDGLMIDSEPLHRQAFNEVLKPYNAHVSLEEWQGIIGGTVLSACEKFVKWYKLPISPEELKALKIARLREILPGIRAKPGLYDLLDKIELPLAIASQSRRETIDIVTEVLGLEKYFDAIVAHEEAGRPKPAPDVYLATAGKLGIEPGECLALEDTGMGLQSAKAAGMKCYAIPSPEAKGHDFSAADRILGSLDEVYDAMKTDSFI